MAKAKTAGRVADQQDPASGSPAGDQGAGTDSLATAVGEGDLGTAASTAVEQAQEQAASLGDQVRQQALQQVTTQKERAAGGLALAADVLRQAGQQVRDQEQPAVAGAIDTAAARVEGWADALQHQDVPQLVDETRAFARRQPALFVGGALTLGFLGVRFLKSSPTAQRNGSAGDQSDAGTGTPSSPSPEQNPLPDELVADRSSLYPEAATFDADEAELESIPFPATDDPTRLEDR